MAEGKEPEGEGKEPEGEVQPKKFPLKLIILGGLVIVLVAGGFFVWNMHMKESKTEAQVFETIPQKIEKEEAAAYPLDSFIVNLMDKTGLSKRYLKVGMILEIGKQEQGMILDKYKPQMRDTILILLSSKSFIEINTMEGKLELKQALLSRLNQILGSVIVRRIYFQEFVVQ
jgi:flagellar protein FliL